MQEPADFLLETCVSVLVRIDSGVWIADSALAVYGYPEVIDGWKRALGASALAVCDRRGERSGWKRVLGASALAVCGCRGERSGWKRALGVSALAVCDRRGERSGYCLGLLVSGIERLTFQREKSVSLLHRNAFALEIEQLGCVGELDRYDLR